MVAETGGTNTAAPEHQGDRLKRFRFDLLPLTCAGNTLMAVLLTAETAANEVFAWTISQPLATKLRIDLVDATHRLGHVIDSADPTIGSFTGLPTLEHMPEASIASLARTPRIIHLDAWSVVYVLDVTCTDDVTRRISLPPQLAALFALQLGDALDEISNAV